MRTDMQTLIAALTTERNSLDRAIAALKAITPEKPAATERPAPRAPRRKTRVHLSADTKAVIVARMAQAGSGDLHRTAKSLAREFGGHAGTIYTGWKTWQRLQAPASSSNGSDAPTPKSQPVHDYATV